MVVFSFLKCVCAWSFCLFVIAWTGLQRRLLIIVALFIYLFERRFCHGHNFLFDEPFLVCLTSQACHLFEKHGELAIFGHRSASFWESSHPSISHLDVLPVIAASGRVD